MLKPCGTNEGLIVLVDGGTYRVLAGDWPTINAQLIELGRAGMVAVDANGAPVITPIGDNALNALREV